MSVPTVRLGNICKIKTGEMVNKSIIAARLGSYPVINSGRDPLGFIDTWNVDDDPIGIASRGSVGLITWTDGKFFRGNLNYSCTPKDRKAVSSRYLFHALHFLQPDIQLLATHEGIPALNKSNLEKLAIPLPSIGLQHDIVSILDTFTELEAELEAELKARRGQYAIYKSDLLNFGADVSTVRIGDVCSISSGGTPSKSEASYWDDGSIPWLRSECCNNALVQKANDFITDLGLRNSSAKLLQRNTTLMALVGATIFKTGYIEFESATNQNIASIKALDKNKLKDKFIFYYLTNQYTALKNTISNYGMLNLTTLREIKIPIPSLYGQESIVAILDKFDALINDLSTGLPAELSARRQQYEYYRNKLLTFKEAA